MFKIHINDGNNETPKDDIFYIISKEGIFLKKKVGLIDSITPVDKISFLSTMKEENKASINIPKIPANLTSSVWLFFKKVYEKYNGEAIMLIYYNEKNKKYKMIVPKQEVSGGSLDYKTSIENGFNLIGDIHSHGSMSAFHSGTDSYDEKSFDGIHITFGNMNKEYFSISTSIVVNGFRVIVDSEKYLNGIEKYNKTTIKNDSITTRSPLLNKLINQENNSLKHDMYIITTPYEKINYIDSWMDNVSKKVYKPTNIGHYQSNQKYINSFDFYELSKIANKQRHKNNNGEHNNRIGINENPCEGCVFRDYKVELIKDEMEEYNYEENVMDDEYKNILFNDCHQQNDWLNHEIDDIDEIMRKRENDEK